MNIPLSVKAGQLFVVTIFCVYVFYNIYLNFCNRKNFDAIYLAVMNQTLNGGAIAPATDTEKLILSTQCILAFFISTGLLIISFNL